LQAFKSDFQAIAEAVQVAEDGRSLRLDKPLKKNRERALFSQDAAVNKVNRQAYHQKGTDVYLEQSLRNSQPISKNEFASTAVGSQYESAFEEWPELHQKFNKMHNGDKANRANLSEEILCNLIS